MRKIFRNLVFNYRLITAINKGFLETFIILRKCSESELYRKGVHTIQRKGVFMVVIFL